MKASALAVRTIGAVLLLSGSAALAQPNSMSSNQFGDRQSGKFGDPSQGHFGNAADGYFDNAKITEPAAGTPSLGKVYRKQAANSAEYVSLAVPAEDSAKPVSQAKKKHRKQSAK